MKHKDKFKQTEVGIIPEDWEIVKIGDVARINEVLINKKNLFDKIEYIDIESVNNGIVEKPKILALHEAPSRAKRILRNNDIIISTVRPNLRHFAFIDKAKPNLIASTGFAVITSMRINPRFLYYFLINDKFTEYLTAIADAHTSTYPSFNPDIIENSYCPYPDEAEQINIAKILSDLDSRIELNQLMNKILETVGQTLFKRWFIDFEFPDDEGRPYKSSGGEMVDSEFGKIPKGWRVGKVFEIAEQIKNQIKPNENINKNRVYFHYSIEAFDSGMKPAKQLGSEILSNKFIVKRNTILISKLNPRIQRIWPVIKANENSICSTEFLVFKSKINSFSYLYFMFLSNNVRRKMVSMARGTSSSHQRISADDLLNLPILIPQIQILDLFDGIVLPKLKKREQNVSLEMVLSEIGDCILPKLISGKVRVPVEARG